MSNAAILRAAHEAFSDGRHDEAAQLVAEVTDFVDHGRGISCQHRGAFRVWLDSHKALASDMRLIDAHYIEQGEWVTARFRAVGTQTGPLGAFPATGEPFVLDVCEVWRFNARGEAIEGHNYSDGLGLLIQLGHLPAPV